MDPNKLDMLETVEKPNKFYIFIKKVTFTLHFLLPVSLVSFFLLYNSDFSFFYSYNYHLPTFVFPLLTQVFERKYMFLLCNGILAFLAKNVCFSSSYYAVSDTNGEFLDGSELDHEIKKTSEAPLEESEIATEKNEGSPQHAELEKEVEQGDQEEKAGGAEKKEKMYSDAEEDEREEDFLISEDNELEYDEEIEEGWGGPIGESTAEEGITLNMNTEELNKKIEAFIRKMKEEIRIEAQQQLIMV